VKIEPAIEIATSLWHHIKDGEWEKARALLADDFEAYWPQSRELIKGPENFIRINREYPGTHKIEIYDTLHRLDRWDFVDHVITEVYIQSKFPDGKETNLYAISHFEIEEEKILEIKEYWAETYPAPEWRKHLVAYL